MANRIIPGPSTASSNTASSSGTLAARRWKMFGRLGRGPKLPVKRAESESSSESDDGSEDSSSLEDALEENGEAECEMDSKDLCVEIKAKEKGGGGKAGGKANAERLHTPLSGGRSPSPCGGGREESPARLGDLLQDGVGGGGNAPQGEEDKKPAAPENSWMKWDDDRTTRANQDCQRELESTAVRELVKYFGKRKVRTSVH